MCNSVNCQIQNMKHKCFLSNWMRHFMDLKTLNPPLYYVFKWNLIALCRNMQCILKQWCMHQNLYIHWCNLFVNFYDESQAQIILVLTYRYMFSIGKRPALYYIRQYAVHWNNVSYNEKWSLENLLHCY